MFLDKLPEDDFHKSKHNLHSNVCYTVKRAVLAEEIHIDMY